METKQLFYSLYEITLTQKVIEKISTCLENPLEELITFTFRCFTTLEWERSSYKNYKNHKDGSNKKYSFSKKIKEKDPFFKDVEDQVSFFNDLEFFWKEVGMREFYIFRYKNRIFVLLVGETIIVSNWHITISQTFNKVINQIKISDRIEDFVVNYNLKDYTYSEVEEEKKPRRLRSLGGGLRRLLLKTKNNDKSLTNKKIIEDLDYFIASGDGDKLLTQLSAVENNLRLNPQIKTKDIILNHLPIDHSFAIIEEKVYQVLEECEANEKKQLIGKIENFQLSIRKIVKDSGVLNQSFNARVEELKTREKMEESKTSEKRDSFT